MRHAFFCVAIIIMHVYMYTNKHVQQHDLPLPLVRVCDLMIISSIIIIIIITINNNNYK
jgi:hypothetical protein